MKIHRLQLDLMRSDWKAEHDKWFYRRLHRDMFKIAQGSPMQILSFKKPIRDCWKIHDAPKAHSCMYKILNRGRLTVYSQERIGPWLTLSTRCNFPRAGIHNVTIQSLRVHLCFAASASISESSSLLRVNRLSPNVIVCFVSSGRE